MTVEPGYCYEQAKGMAQMGYKLVPIGVGKKYPPIQKWQEEATDDDKTITGWFKSQRNGLGWAMGLQPNGMYLVAIDIDGEEGGVRVHQAGDRTPRVGGRLQAHRPTGHRLERRPLHLLDAVRDSQQRQAVRRPHRHPG